MSLDNTISKSSVIVASQDRLSSDMGNETILLDIKSGIYYGLNSVGARIWNFIQEPKKVVEIRDAIVAKYQIESNRCESDILTLLEELAAEGLIEVQDEAVA